MHLEPPQGEVDLVKIVINPDRAILAHYPLDARVEEPVQVQMGIQGPQQRQSSCETFLGALADAVMIARVVDLLQPASELAVEFLQRANSLAQQTQAGFKVLLQGAEHPFDFTAAPGPTRL